MMKIICSKHVQDIVFFLLGNSPASEVYMPTFRNTLFHLHRQVGMNMESTGCQASSAYKIQTPGNFPEESIQHSEQDESLKYKNVQDSLIAIN